MCFSETRAEKHVETAAGTELGALHHAIRESSTARDSDSQVLKEKAPLGRSISLTA
ncbi:mCG140801 [Mus musculus]|nr:mCG140801 [Mus musculus]